MSQKIKIAHVINPFNAPVDHPSHLYYAQPVTFESMIRARNNAKDVMDISFYTVQYAEDHDVLTAEQKKEFICLPDLQESVQDYFEFNNKSKKLPLIRHILKTLYDNTDDHVDYFIYTNVDIALQPNFYLYIKNKIDEGYDSLCIHRCDIPKYLDKTLLDVSKLDLMYNITGKHTFGHDCFVFPRSMYNNLVLNNVFIGYIPFGCVMKNQIKKNAKQFKEIHSRENLTFHIGFDKVVDKKTEYHIANNKTANNMQWG